MRARFIFGLSDIALGEDSRMYETVPPGAFDVETSSDGHREFWFKCPGKCGTIAPLALRPWTGPDRPTWGFNDDFGDPTLDPSVDHKGCWHGWLKAGEWSSV